MGWDATIYKVSNVLMLEAFFFYCFTSELLRVFLIKPKENSNR